MIAAERFFQLDPVALNPIQFQAGVRQTRLNALELLTELAAFVVKGKNVFFLGLLATPQRFQFLAEA